MTNHSIQSSKPWLKEKGRRLSISQLKRVSKQWTPETWEAYLKTLETPRMAEFIEDLKPQHKEMALLENTKTETEMNEKPPIPISTQKLLTEAMARLNRKEQRLIRAIFWRGLSERELAVELGISRLTVRSYKVRTLNKLRLLLPPTLHIYIGGNKPSAAKERHLEGDIRPSESPHSVDPFVEGIHSDGMPLA